MLETPISQPTLVALILISIPKHIRPLLLVPRLPQPHHAPPIPPIPHHNTQLLRNWIKPVRKILLLLLRLGHTCPLRHHARLAHKVGHPVRFKQDDRLAAPGRAEMGAVAGGGDGELRYFSSEGGVDGGAD
jgi:hypothetical protein